MILYYYIPNTFTPDKDGMNDKFGPKGIRMEKYESYEFTVFNNGEKKYLLLIKLVDNGMAKMESQALTLGLL